MDFELDSKQTRRLFLAGTVAFPTPFPSLGTISVEKGRLRRSDEDNNAPDELFVVVQEKAGIDRAKVRVVRQEDVAAIFIPEMSDYADDPLTKCCCDEEDLVRDLEQGIWILKPGRDVAELIQNAVKGDSDSAEKKAGRNTAEKNKKRRIDVGRRDSGVKGIVFVPRHQPVLTIEECTHAAGDVDPYIIKAGCA
jgi:hypothetical protein